MKTLIMALGALSVLCAFSQESRAASRFEFEEDFSLPIVYFSIVVDVGAAHDPADKQGLAKVGSQMLLRGTQKLSKEAFFEQLNNLGGTIEVEVREEGTIFRAAVLSENAGKFLSLFAEALTKPKFTSEELTKVKKQIEGEILEQKGNDKVLVRNHFNRFLYGSHPYGNPVNGTQKTLKKISSKDVIDYYTKYYGAKSVTLFGTGALKSSVAEEWFHASIVDTLNALHPEAGPAPAVAKPEIAKGRRALIIDKPKATQAQVLLGGVGIRPEFDGFYATQLANHSFGGGSFSARMMQEIRVKRGWTYGAYNSFRFGRHPRHFAMYFFPKTDDTVPAIQLSLGMFEDFVSKGITQEEFTFARDSLVNNAPFNYDTPKKRLDNATVEYLNQFPHGYFKEYADHIKSVSYGKITESLKEAFDPSTLALTVVGDAQKLKPLIEKLPGFSAPVVKNYLED